MPTRGPCILELLQRGEGTSCRWDSAWVTDRPGRRCDVGAELRTGEIDLLDGGVGLLACFGHRLARADEVEDAAAGGDELPCRSAVPAWKTSALVAPATSTPPDRDAALRIVRIPRAARTTVTAACDRLELDTGEVAVRGGRECLEEIAAEAGRSACVSGSPNRQLNSRTRGPASVSIRPP